MLLNLQSPHLLISYFPTTTTLTVLSLPLLYHPIRPAVTRQRMGLGDGFVASVRVRNGCLFMDIFGFSSVRL